MRVFSALFSSESDGEDCVCVRARGNKKRTRRRFKKVAISQADVVGKKTSHIFSSPSARYFKASFPDLARSVHPTFGALSSSQPLLSFFSACSLETVEWSNFIKFCSCDKVDDLDFGFLSDIMYFFVLKRPLG